MYSEAWKQTFLREIYKPLALQVKLSEELR